MSRMKITRRYVNVKRHTVGYFVGGKRRTVSEVNRMARRGLIQNARAVANHVQGVSGQPALYDLPEVIV